MRETASRTDHSVREDCFIGIVVRGEGVSSEVCSALQKLADQSVQPNGVGETTVYANCEDDHGQNGNFAPDKSGPTTPQKQILARGYTKTPRKREASFTFSVDIRTTQSAISLCFYSSGQNEQPKLASSEQLAKIDSRLSPISKSTKEQRCYIPRSDTDEDIATSPIKSKKKSASRVQVMNGVPAKECIVAERPEFTAQWGHVVSENVGNKAQIIGWLPEKEDSRTSPTMVPENLGVMGVGTNLSTFPRIDALIHVLQEYFNIEGKFELILCEHPLKTGCFTHVGREEIIALKLTNPASRDVYVEIKLPAFGDPIFANTKGFQDLVIAGINILIQDESELVGLPKEGRNLMAEFAALDSQEASEEASDSTTSDSDCSTAPGSSSDSDYSSDSDAEKELPGAPSANRYALFNAMPESFQFNENMSEPCNPSEEAGYFCDEFSIDSSNFA